MAKEFTIPDNWGLSPQQEAVIGSLIDNAGEYISAPEFCIALYDVKTPGPAPAKLRVLMQRCREILTHLSNGEVEIETRRYKGWRITKKSRIILRRLCTEE